VFGFQRLDVYRDAIAFLSHAASLSATLPRGHSELVDQLKRAAMSVPLNIAEGSGKFGRESARFYAIARGSALECAAIIDVLEALKVLETPPLAEPREVLRRTIARLTALLRAHA
jgi:four helix bundle protein